MALKRITIKRMKKEFKKDRLLLIETVLSMIIFLLVISLTLFSLLTPKYRVTFDSNGGTVITSRSVKHNKVIAPPTPPIKEGYEFIGWYYNDELYLFDKGITEDIELIARWEEIKKEQIKNIEITAEEFSMPINQTIKLPYTIEPLLDEKIFWESSDSSIIEVDVNGNITSKAEGIAVVKVSNANGVADEIKVTVDKEAILLDEFSFETNEIIIKVGTVKQLNLILKPINASNTNFLWSSDDTSIITVDNKGVISAKGEGEAIVVATSLENKKMAKCKVIVTKS